MSTILPPQPTTAPTGPQVGVSTSSSRASGMGFDALAAMSDYAKVIISGDAKARGLAAHRAGRAVLDLAAYAEELEGRVL